MFWDVDKIDVDEDVDFIIDRVLNWFMGDVSYLGILELIYPLDVIKHYAVTMDIRGNERIEFICDRYSLEANQFKYYLNY